MSSSCHIANVVIQMLAWHIFLSVICCYSVCRCYWETVALNIVSRLICGWLVGTGLLGKVSVNCISWMHFMKIRSYSSLPSSIFFLRLGDFGGDIQNKVLSLGIKAYVQHSGFVQVRADNVHDIWIIQRVGALDATGSPVSILFTLLEIEKLVLKCTSQEQWNVSFGIEMQVECCI